MTRRTLSLIGGGVDQAQHATDPLAPSSLPGPRHLVRRLARAKRFGAHAFWRAVRARWTKGRRPAPLPLPPFHVDARVPRRLRAGLLREQGRPVTGRQWKRYRKALRRGAA